MNTWSVLFFIYTFFWIQQSVVLGEETKSENVFDTQTRIVAAHNALLRYRLTSSAELERSCFSGKCEYKRVLELLSNPAQAGQYWSVLNCVKFGITCGHDGVWLPWQEWEECSATCGVGEQIRWRECDQVELWGERCESSYTQVRNCTRILPMHCAENPSKPDTWGGWGEWSDCDVTCGNQGRVNRSRDCLPFHDELFCVGDSTESRGCAHVPTCPVDGGWSNWDDWSGCQVMTCGRGWRMRTRSCTNPRAKGTGKLCSGPSSQHVACEGEPCIGKFITTFELMICYTQRLHNCVSAVSERPIIAHLTEHSSILYPDQPPASFLSVVLRFRPISSQGTLLRYSGISKDYVTPTTSQLVTVENPTTKAKKFNDDFVVLKLDTSGHVTMTSSINGSDLVKIECGKFKVAEWNVVRLLMVSDVIHVRVNNGENMIATLQDTPGKNPATFNNSSANWWNGMWGFIGGKSAQASSALLRTRAILSSFRGTLGLGKVRNTDVGVRGYISRLRVNYEDFSFTTVSETARPKHARPLVNKGVELLSTNENHRPEGARLLYFNGQTRVHIPFTLKWWSDHGEPLTYTDNFTYSDVTSYDLATLEVTFKPYHKDGIILWNRGSKDRASQLKLTIEDGKRAKFVAAHGGLMKMLLSDDVIRLRQWNKIVLQFLRDGETRMRVNNGAMRTVVIPTITEQNKPGSVLVLGGARKNLFEYNVDVRPLSATERTGAPFRGYIFSLKQNGIETMIDGRGNIDVEGRLTSLFATKPVSWKFLYFAPITTEDTSQTTSRQLHCFLPLSSDATSSITWFKDEIPVAGNHQFVVQHKTTASQIQSTLILNPSVEDSRDKSDAFSCVAKSGNKIWVIINHVVAVVNAEIIAPGGAASVLNFIKKTTGTSDTLAIYIALGSVSGLCVVIILLVSVKNYWKKRVKQKRKRLNSKKTSPSSERKPLVKKKFK
ncbi:uncharacterized protein LOC100180507 isoform X1 [Ciona intestinalis]